MSIISIINYEGCIHVANVLHGQQSAQHALFTCKATYEQLGERKHGKKQLLPNAH